MKKGQQKGCRKVSYTILFNTLQNSTLSSSEMDQNYFQSFISLTLCFLSLSGGFLLGKRSTATFPCRVDNVQDNIQTIDQNIDIKDITDLTSSSQSFSCNTRRVLDELTRLHKISDMLESRRKRGEANRARSATIVRKEGQSKAAESSFRRCVGDMMPELLERWESDLNSNKLNLRKWDESAEQQVDGITFDVLRETAEELELDQA